MKIHAEQIFRLQGGRMSRNGGYAVDGNAAGGNLGK